MVKKIIKLTQKKSYLKLRLGSKKASKPNYVPTRTTVLKNSLALSKGWKR